MAKKVKIKFPSRTRQGERYMVCRNSVPGGNIGQVNYVVNGEG